jgi:hypothetical protein
VSRTYSTVLLHCIVPAADEGTWVVDRVVPIGHTWVLRHISVTADVEGQLGWRVTVLGPDIPSFYGAVEVPITGGLAGAALMSSEWEGRAVIHAGYTLRFQNMAQLGNDSGTGYAHISGYDLVD